MVESTQIVAPETGAHAPAPVVTPERPAWLPAKFATPEDFAASYGELERKQSEANAVTDVAKEAADKAAADAAALAVAKGEPAPDAAPEANTDDTVLTPVTYGKAVDSALETAGLKPADVAAEYKAEGKITDDTLAKLEAAGFSKDVVATYVKGFENANATATADQLAAATEIKKVAGGDEGYDKMVNWASASLPEADVAAFNAIMDKGDAAIAKLAVEGLHAKFIAAEGKDPTLLTGGAAGGTDQYQSWAEQSAAMTAARASKDPAQIRAVEQKSLRSNLG